MGSDERLDRTQNRTTSRSPIYERWRWQIFGITWLAYVGLYLTRKSFSVVKIELEKPTVMGMTIPQMSWVDGTYGVAYALGNIFWGPMGDRFGPRRVVAAGLFASVIAALLMGASNSVLLFSLLFGIQGLCQSTGWGPLTKNLGAFFSLRERGWVVGLWCTNMPVGACLAAAIAATATTYWGWRYGFWAPAGCLLVVAVIFLLLQRNHPRDVGLPPIEEYHGEPSDVVVAGDRPEEEPEGSWKVIAEVLTSKMVWLLAAAYLLIKPTRYLIMFWAPLYVKQRLGTGLFESSAIGSLPEVAGVISPFLGGWLSDHMFRAKRLPPSILALFACAGLWFAFGYLPPTRLAMGLGLFAIGFLIYIPESLLSGSAAIDFGTKKGASTASGLINGCGSIGALVGETVPGWVKATIAPGQDIWKPIFFGLGAGLTLAALLLLPQWNRLPPHAAPAKPTGADGPNSNN